MTDGAFKLLIKVFSSIDYSATEGLLALNQLLQTISAMGYTVPYFEVWILNVMNLLHRKQNARRTESPLCSSNCSTTASCFISSVPASALRNSWSKLYNATKSIYLCNNNNNKENDSISRKRGKPKFAQKRKKREKVNVSGFLLIWSQ